MRVHWLQHAAFEGLGCIEPWLKSRRHTLAGTRLYAGETPPAVQDFDWLIVMGGPMNIYEHDRHPWLVPEKALIRDAIHKDKRVLGICLGAQLIADVLGAKVTRNRETEIGWFPVRLTAESRNSPFIDGFPAEFETLHWHGDTFGIPKGALHLAASEACAHQAFSYGERVLALQFHPEVTADGIRALADNDPVKPAPFVQMPAEMLRDPRRFTANNQRMEKLLERMAAA